MKIPNDKTIMSKIVNFISKLKVIFTQKFH